MLARRLSRHGLALPAVALASALAPAASASVPPGLVSSTVGAALAAQGPATLVSANVTTLAEGVMKTMFLSKLKVLKAILVLVALLGTAGGLLSWAAAPKAAPAAKVQDDPKPAPKAKKAKDADPGFISSAVIFNKQVQKELRLSPRQIKQLDAVRLKIADTYRTAIKKTYEESRKGNFKPALKLQRKYQDDERAALRKAVPGIVSAGGLKRLQQIQRQFSGLHRVLFDPAVRKTLKLNDEQAKDIETVFKEARPEIQKEMSAWFKKRGGYGPIIVEDMVAAQQKANAPAVKKALKVLTAEQRKIWRDLIGEPFTFKPHSRK
jgi:hypothetical protein